MGDNFPKSGSYGLKGDKTFRNFLYVLRLEMFIFQPDQHQKQPNERQPGWSKLSKDEML